MSKEERRQLFEAQVRAQDEMQAEIMRKQHEAYVQFYSRYANQDPNNPNPLTDPSNPLIGVDPKRVPAAAARNTDEDPTGAWWVDLGVRSCQGWIQTWKYRWGSYRSMVSDFGI